MDQVERPEMTFETLTFSDPLVQFEKIMKAVGGNCVVLEKGQDVNEVIRNVFPDAKSIASNLPEVTCATVNPDTLDDPRELNGTDVGVIRGISGFWKTGWYGLTSVPVTKALFFYFRGLGDPT